MEMNGIWTIVIGVLAGLALVAVVFWLLLLALGALMNWAQPNKPSGRHTSNTENEDEVYHRFHDHR